MIAGYLVSKINLLHETCTSVTFSLIHLWLKNYTIVIKSFNYFNVRKGMALNANAHCLKSKRGVTPWC